MKNERRNMVSKDTIYRQEAIDALETVKPIKAENGELYITKINARMKLEKLPSAQSKQRMRQIGEDTVLFSVPMEDLDATSRVILESGMWCKTFYTDGQSRWIPVSERLPDISESVLICDIDGDICIGHRTRFGYYYPDFCDDKIESVTAWMPMPEPYRVEDKDDI